MRERFQARMKPQRPPDNPWLMRGIVVFASVIVLIGAVWAALLGHFFH